MNEWKEMMSEFIGSTASDWNRGRKLTMVMMRWRSGAGGDGEGPLHSFSDCLISVDNLEHNMCIFFYYCPPVATAAVACYLVQLFSTVYWFSIFFFTSLAHFRRICFGVASAIELLEFLIIDDSTSSLADLERIVSLSRRVGKIYRFSSSKGWSLFPLIYNCLLI